MTLIVGLPGSGLEGMKTGGCVIGLSVNIQIP
jgi:hypothetical protein